MPDEKVFNNAVRWVVDNVIKKNKNLKEIAEKKHANLKSQDARYFEHLR